MQSLFMSLAVSYFPVQNVLLFFFCCVRVLQDNWLSGLHRAHAQGWKPFRAQQAVARQGEDRHNTFWGVKKCDPVFLI